jgi:uncharacterized protein YraI
MRPTITPFVSTSTLSAAPATVLLKTPIPLSLQPTIVVAEGITSTQVNVRIEPSTASTVLGVLPADMRVEITGRDPGGNWWQILYPHPQAVAGKGWITAQYVSTITTPEVPIIGGAQAGPSGGNVAIVQEQINVRSGPGTGFNSLGTLNPQDVVNLTGKDPNGAWLQIDFALGPEGKGWVNSAFVQAHGVENLPILAESGLVIGTGTPTVIPPTPTPTVIPARDDGDSAEHPLTSVILEAAGTQAFIYTGDLSAPQGDREDWIAFSPYGRLILASLECKGNDALKVQLLENGSPADTYIECGTQMQELAVVAGARYLIHLQADPSAPTLQYTSYILTIKTRP